jgi:hypothetical protein
MAHVWGGATTALTTRWLGRDKAMRTCVRTYCMEMLGPRVSSVAEQFFPWAGHLILLMQYTYRIFPHEMEPYTHIRDYKSLADRNRKKAPKALNTRCQRKRGQILLLAMARSDRVSATNVGSEHAVGQRRSRTWPTIFFFFGKMCSRKVVGSSPTVSRSAIGWLWHLALASLNCCRAGRTNKLAIRSWLPVRQTVPRQNAPTELAARSRVHECSSVSLALSLSLSLAVVTIGETGTEMTEREGVLT